MKIRDMHALPYGGQAGGRLTQIQKKDLLLLKYMVIQFVETLLNQRLNNKREWTSCYLSRVCSTGNNEITLKEMMLFLTCLGSEQQWLRND